jgi:hypothetical protein
MAIQNAINANASTPISPTIGGTGVSNPTAHGILIGEGSSAATSLVLSAGQIPIGTTSSDPAGATLTAGTGISIGSTTGAITITNTAGGVLAWSDVTGTTQAKAINNGYIADNAGLVTLTLPATAAIGSVISVQGKGAGGWAIAQNASQAIHFGNIVTTTGTGGSLASSNQWDSITVICVTANNIWAVLGGAQGNITYV